MTLDPFFQKRQPAKINHKAVFIKPLAAKLNFKAPVVAVNQRARAFVPMLAMGKGNIRVKLGAGKHDPRAERKMPYPLRVSHSSYSEVSYSRGSIFSGVHGGAVSVSR